MVISQKPKSARGAIAFLWPGKSFAEKSRLTPFAGPRFATLAAGLILRAKTGEIPRKRLVDFPFWIIIQGPEFALHHRLYLISLGGFSTSYYSTRFNPNIGRQVIGNTAFINTE